MKAVVCQSAVLGRKSWTTGYPLVTASTVPTPLAVAQSAQVQNPGGSALRSRGAARESR
jgi:hypothetical protein